jgi:hypothetical protein
MDNESSKPQNSISNIIKSFEKSFKESFEGFVNQRKDSKKMKVVSYILLMIIIIIILCMSVENTDITLSSTSSNVFQKQS